VRKTSRETSIRTVPKKKPYRQTCAPRLWKIERAKERQANIRFLESLDALSNLMFLRFGSVTTA